MGDDGLVIGGGWLFTQTAMLFAAYGLGYALPWWVRWFPTIIALPIMLFFSLLFAAIVAVVKKS